MNFASAERRRIFTVLVTVSVWLSFTAWIRPLALPDEGRYVGVAWEMLRSGQWLVPTLDGLPFFHKPPLFYWLTAMSLSVTGPHVWPGRLVSVASAVLASMSLYLFARKWSDSRVATWSVIVLATQPLFFGAAQFANLDMLVAVCITASILLAAHAALCVETGQLGYRRPLVAAYAMAALGVLAKGLIGAVLPAAIILGWLLLARRARLIANLVSLTGFVVFGVLSVPWFVLMEHQFAGFSYYLFVHHHLERFAQSGFNNQQPFWFYVPVVAVLTLPWFPAIALGWRMPAASFLDRRRILRLLHWVWFVGIVAFFSIPNSKLIGYVLPALPPLAYLIADGVWAATENPQRTHQRLIKVAALAIVICFGGIVAARLFDDTSSAPLAKVLAQQRSRGEPVVFLGQYFYDVPFYAQLDEPVVVIDDWKNSNAHDNWRKELYDAGRFEPKRARLLLRSGDYLAKSACERPVTWVVALRAAARDHAVLASAAIVASTRTAALWRLDHEVCSNPERIASAGGSRQRTAERTFARSATAVHDGSRMPNAIDR